MGKRRRKKEVKTVNTHIPRFAPSRAPAAAVLPDLIAAPLPAGAEEPATAGMGPLDIHYSDPKVDPSGKP